MCRTSWVVVVALAGAALQAAADSKGKPAVAPKDYIRWMTNWEQAKAEAAERNVPIVFAWHKDH